MGKGRQCAESCNELLLAELQAHYRRQDDGMGPPGTAAIEAIGFRVGRQLVERYSKDRSRMAEPLDVIKFICRDFWTEVFKKQVDNLRTNHRGTYVLRDNSFRWTLKLAAGPPSSPGGTMVLRDQLVYPCALIRGALSQLGVEAQVSADPSNAPTVEFNMYIRQR